MPPGSADAHRDSAGDAAARGGSSDRSDPLAFAAAAVDDLQERGLYRPRRIFERQEDGRLVAEGRPCLDFASNDYLGLLASGPLSYELLAGAGASALVTGRSPSVAALEQAIARFERTESALVFPTGYAACQGTTAALVHSGDAVFLDKLCHSCLVEGARLSRATLRVYRDDRLEALARDLAKHVRSRRRLIVTDGVFSMDGRLAPLPELLALAEQFDALLLVDEAHATGVFGSGGRGACEHFGLSSDRLIRVGTLSKAVAALGGFAVGPVRLIDFLRHHARTQMFSTALPPIVCAAASVGLTVIRHEPERRERLHTAAERVRRDLRAQGWTIPESVGPILPVHLGLPERTTSLAAKLETDGLVVGAIRPPTVPRGTSRLRIVVNAEHSDDDLAALVAAMDVHRADAV